MIGGLLFLLLAFAALACVACGAVAAGYAAFQTGLGEPRWRRMAISVGFLGALFALSYENGYLIAFGILATQSALYAVGRILRAKSGSA